MLIYRYEIYVWIAAGGGGEREKVELTAHHFVGLLNWSFGRHQYMQHGGSPLLGSYCSFEILIVESGGSRPTVHKWIPTLQNEELVALVNGPHELALPLALSLSLSFFTCFSSPLQLAWQRQTAASIPALRAPDAGFFQSVLCSNSFILFC